MKFIGNSSSTIDWKSLVNRLRGEPGRFRGSNQEDDIHDNPKVAELRKQWQLAGYDGHKAVGWVDHDVPEDVVAKFAEFVGATTVGAWITSVPPGYCVPWHYDITDDEDAMLAVGYPLRYTCHISEPKFGQVFVLENKVFANESQGNVYQWTDWQQWHGGMNMGLEAKFLFNFIGYAK
jgi:hypothetical protein